MMNYAPSLKVKAAAELELRRRVAARSPIFRGAAETAQTITDRSWILAGPAETGKTYAGLYRLDSLARQYGDQYVLARKVRATMDSTVLATWRRIIGLRGGVTVFGGEHPQFYVYPNGARVWIVGFDNPDKILSGEFGAAYINQAEELSEADYETLTTRVTGRGASTPHPMVFGDCNPGPEDHWIIRRRDAGALTLLESRHEDNPALHDELDWTEQGKRALAILDRLTGVRYLRLRLGRWVGAEGAYFTQLDATRHMVEYDRVPPGWHVWAALDYGFVHLLSFGVFGAYEGRVVLFGRHAAHHWYIPQHVEAMDDLLLTLGVEKRGLEIVAGHDCWNGGKDDPETIADKFARHGYYLERAVIARIIGARNLGERLGNPDAGVDATLQFNRRHGGQAVFDALARMVHDPYDQEDVRKVNCDVEGRGGDDDYDMARYGGMKASAAPALAPAVRGNRPMIEAMRRGLRR